MSQSQSREDYLKFIFESQGQDRVSNKAIAQGLHVAPPSVSEMITKLSHEGYVDYKPYYGVRLTQKGVDYARGISRKHLIWEYFLVHHLGLKAEDVHNQAEILEHATTDDLAEHLAKYIDFPEDYQGPH